jgi:hypothetical protein
MCPDKHENTRRALIISSATTVVAFCSAVVLTLRQRQSIDWDIFIDRVRTVTADSGFTQLDTVNQIAGIAAALNLDNTTLKKILLKHERLGHRYSVEFVVSSALNIAGAT